MCCIQFRDPGSVLLQTVVSIVLPVFGLVGVGFVLGWLEFFPEGTGRGLENYLHRFALPLLIFNAVSKANLPDEPNWELWIAYFAGMYMAWALTQISLRSMGHERAIAFIGGFTAAFSNMMLIGIPLVVFLVQGSPLSWELPVFKEDGPILRRGYQADAGMVLKPEFIGLWLALSLYTASFIAEIVRAGILAVPHGQTEASQALGLSGGMAQRLIIIPQALRVIVPPLTSQFLNLTKNSSLAVAIAYPDIVSVFAGTALNQIGQEIEMIFMMMMLYLILSLLTSLFMNWFNARIRLVER